MDFKEYQGLAARTSRGGEDAKRGSTMGLAGEAGEVVDMLKKVFYHGHELDPGQLAKELGDVMWYVSDLATQFGIGLDDIARGNIEKLKARYPDGFSEARSRTRKKGDT